jgi:formylglycine-generating enzyme required for sulfatase activity
VKVVAAVVLVTLVACGGKPAAERDSRVSPDHGTMDAAAAVTLANDAATTNAGPGEEPPPEEEVADGDEPSHRPTWARDAYYTPPQLPAEIPSLPRPGREPLAPPDLGPPAAGQTVPVAAGTFLRGSWPGTRGRDPVKEVDLVPTKVRLFEIDRLPYPNDPAQEPLTNVTRREAEERCTRDGKRLCTDVEWEYACKGPQSQTYPYGDDYDESRYGDRLQPVSSFGVLGMTGLYEWTAGDWKDPKGSAAPNIAPLRGAAPGEGDVLTRRCAMRTGLDPARASPRAGFRCCRGSGFPLPYDVETIKRAVRPAPLLNDAMLSRLVRAVPELWRAQVEPRIQSEDVLTRALLRSSRTEASGVGFSISIQPLFWMPTQSEELLVVVGRSGHDLFAAAMYVTGIPNVYEHAANVVLTDVPDDEGIALFGGLRDRKLLGWGECDDCREGGSFEYHEEDGTIAVNHRW